MSNPLSNRRSFLKTLAVVTVGGRVLLNSGSVRAAADAAGEAAADPTTWPSMPRRELGRTGFQASRLIFGCGAALSQGRKDGLLQTAFDAGINVFDVGSSHFYADAERNLAPFLKTHRDEVFLISKAMVGLDLEPTAQITTDQAKQAASTWSERLDESLRQLEVERVDAYYLMATSNPSIVRCEEIARAVEIAKEAGKFSHLGVSTHENQEAVLEAAIATDLFSLAMVGITPAGWYDLPTAAPRANSGAMKDLAPFIAKVRSAGIGLVGMKAARYLAGRPLLRALGWSQADAFNSHFSEKLLAAPMSGFQRSYAYVLAHGMDVVNADMQTFRHLHENFVAAAMADEIAA